MKFFWVLLLTLMSGCTSLQKSENSASVTGLSSKTMFRGDIEFLKSELKEHKELYKKQNNAECTECLNFNSPIFIKYPSKLSQGDIVSELQSTLENVFPQVQPVVEAKDERLCGASVHTKEEDHCWYMDSYSVHVKNEDFVKNSESSFFSIFTSEDDRDFDLYHGRNWLEVVIKTSFSIHSSAAEKMVLVKNTNLEYEILIKRQTSSSDISFYIDGIGMSMGRTTGEIDYDLQQAYRLISEAYLKTILYVELFKFYTFKEKVSFFQDFSGLTGSDIDGKWGPKTQAAWEGLVSRCFPNKPKDDPEIMNLKSATLDSDVLEMTLDRLSKTMFGCTLLL